MHWAAGEDQGASRAGQRGLTAGGNSAGWVIVGFSGGRERVTQVRPSLRELSGKLSGRGRVAGPWCHRRGRRAEKQLIKASDSFFFLSPQVTRFNGGRGDGRAGEGKTANTLGVGGINARRGPVGPGTDAYINDRYIISSRAAFDLLSERPLPFFFASPPPVGDLYSPEGWGGSRQPSEGTQMRTFGVVVVRGRGIRGDFFSKEGAVSISR